MDIFELVQSFVEGESALLCSNIYGDHSQAIGLLIGMEDIPLAKQSDCLSSLLTPLCRQVMPNLSAMKYFLFSIPFLCLYSEVL